MEVRDPIFGAIPVSRAEEPLIDHPALIRLRSIKQMGFSEWSFPGAAHSRLLHSVGVMHLAGQAFDLAFREHPLPEPRRAELRQCVRLAALLHDLGHAPFSHCTEFAMPSLRALGLAAVPAEVLKARGDRRASHEDYTIGLLTQSSLTPLISRGFAFTAAHVAALISRELPAPDDFFVIDGLDHRRVLSQIISSELDVDRMDYLVRDSYFSGAKYGQIDVPWLLNNLSVYVENDTVSLALDRRALYAFDDFLVARYHMFVMVYFHHKSIVFEEMLRRYFNGPGNTYSLPADMDEYVQIDDIHLIAHLRQAADPWAQAVSQRRPYERLVELHGTEEEVDLTWAEATLREAGIDTIAASSVGKLSRYAAVGQKRESAPPIFVLNRTPGPHPAAMPITQATEVFERYKRERRIARLYVAPEALERAKQLLNDKRRWSGPLFG